MLLYPSLQWIPPSDDVLCVQPSGILTYVKSLYSSPDTLPSLRHNQLKHCDEQCSCGNSDTKDTTNTYGPKYFSSTAYGFQNVSTDDGGGSSSLSTGEAVVATAVVCVVCSFTAGLLVGVLLTQCVGVCGRRRKRGQTEIPPVYEDIILEKTPAIQLQTNEAYGPVSRT